MLSMLSSCAYLEKEADALKPSARLVDSRIANINLEKVDLVFDLAVDNPNPVAIRLAGLDYDFMIENHSLVSGTAAKGVRLEASQTSNIELPVSLKFQDLKKLPGQIQGQDEFNYTLATNFLVDLPVVGNYSVPLSKSGILPVPKLPYIKLKGMDIKKLGLIGAEIVAKVEVGNPNNFDLGLKNFNYDLSVNQQTWGQGKITQASSVPKKGKAIIEVPLKLDLMSMGEMVQTLLYSKETFNYQLKGDLTVDTGIEMMKSYSMPLNISGKSSIN